MLEPGLLPGSVQPQFLGTCHVTLSASVLACVGTAKTASLMSVSRNLTCHLA